MKPDADANIPVGERMDQIHREQLSALIDGELRSDQARFVIARLEHDAGLSGRHERWQLAGDVLRGQLGAVAPVDFSARIMAALPPPAPTRTARRWPWAAGGALAAGLALVAVISLPPDTTLPAPPLVQLPALAPAGLGAPADNMASVQMTSPAPAAAAPVALARAPAPPRARTARPALPPPVQADLPAVAARAGSPSPFSLPAADLPARPWPRSQLSPASGFNARLPAPHSGPFAPTLDPQLHGESAHWPPAGATR